jgi:carbonic anhydrase/acetyltransferase-like protein (isoleucine patch superfamily)
MIATLEGIAPVIADGVFIAPNATVIGRVTIGRGSSVWFNTVLRGDMDAITVGEDTNIQDLSMVHVDDKVPCVIRSRVTIGHRAIVHGCVLEDECLVGMGSVIQNRARIGTHSLVGSGSVVREGFEVPPGKLVVGVPATIKRDLTEAEIEMILRISRNYAARGKQYLTGFSPLR